MAELSDLKRGDRVRYTVKVQTSRGVHDADGFRVVYEDHVEEKTGTVSDFTGNGLVWVGADTFPHDPASLTKGPHTPTNR